MVIISTLITAALLPAISPATFPSPSPKSPRSAVPQKNIIIIII